MSASVLLIDRPSRSTAALAEFLRAQGLVVHQASDAEDCLARGQLGVDVVLAAAEPCPSALLARLAERSPPVPLIALCDFATEAASAELLRLGAAEVLLRPIDDSSVLATVRRALEHRSLWVENERLRQELGERYRLGTLVSRDPRMQRVFRTVEAVMDSGAGILILGESGTGKTVLARAVHEGSARHAGPFVVVNCGALPASLLESELFGHARGAFTGALRERAGKFESADGGTLFLDEIGTASPELQVKLLRVLEEGRFERVGETRTREADVRVLAATNVDLAGEVAAGRFRADLYYRLHVVGVELPPLRERPADLPLLAERFLVRHAREHGRTVTGFGPGALARLCAHDWPGNVRELENTIERAVLLAPGPLVEAGDLWPEDGRQPRAPAGAPAAGAPDQQPPDWESLPLGPLKQALAGPERWILLRALRRHGGNRQETARTLGINRTTLFNKMRQHGLLSVPSQAARGSASTRSERAAERGAGAHDGDDELREAV